jgi:hypothetical protein
MRRLLIAWCALLTMQTATACSCEGQEDAGFIHAKLQRLPANARGALFQLPYGSSMTLDAAAFTIVSDRHRKPLKAEISWPVLGIEQRGLLSERMLARVGPVGGFQPGARYTITYKYLAPNSRYPARAEFTIDAAALKVGAYHLTPAGSPARRLLALPAIGGTCSSNQAAVTADFAYRIPDNYAPYRSAMIYASEALGNDGSARLIAYSPSLCSPWRLDATTLRGGRDLLHARCEQPATPVAVRGHAGLLEVEDRLQPTNAVQIDLGKAPGQACTGDGMLNEAMANNDTARIKELACAIGNEQRDVDRAPRPSLAALVTLLKLARRPDGPPPACMDAAAARWKAELRMALDLVPGVGYLLAVSQNIADALAPSATLDH